MNKYDTDNYHLVTFNERGAKVEVIPLGNVGLINAQAAGREMVRTDAVHSFVIERVIYNSLDKDEAWLPRPTGRYSDGKSHEGH